MSQREYSIAKQKNCVGGGLLTDTTSGQNKDEDTIRMSGSEITAVNASATRCRPLSNRNQRCFLWPINPGTWGHVSHSRECIKS
jgi:hypothetical protein